MKKLVSISLLALLLYNAFGYYLLFAYEHKNARIDYLEQLPDEAYQVMSYKLADYAIAHDTDFEYVDKELTLEGKSFHIIKKRILGDTLYLYYLPNFKQDELRQNLNDIVETQSITKQSHSTSPIKVLLKSFLKDYIPNDIYILVVRYPEEIHEATVLGNTSDKAVVSPYLSLHSPPPEAA